MKPICVPCQRFYRPKRTGVMFIEGMPVDGLVHSPPGNSAPEAWRPYKVWAGDLWRCEGCGHETISGVPHVPLSEHYKEDFNLYAQRAITTINDC